MQPFRSPSGQPRPVGLPNVRRCSRRACHDRQVVEQRSNLKRSRAFYEPRPCNKSAVMCRLTSMATSRWWALPSQSGCSRTSPYRCACVLARRPRLRAPPFAKTPSSPPEPPRALLASNYRYVRIVEKRARCAWQAMHVRPLAVKQVNCLGLYKALHNSL